MFFTGSAGTGKSFLLREIVKELRKVKPTDSIFVTATTGIAACNIVCLLFFSFYFFDEMRGKKGNEGGNRS